MRRSATVVAAAVLLVLVSSGPAESAVSGAAAKTWAGRIAAFGQRPAGRPHERQAGALVRRRLAQLGYATALQRFRLPDGRRSRNVVGRTPGRTRVIVVAHIDGVWGTPAANDNASGVGLMLEVARELRRKRGVLVAALGAEERHVTGSSLHLGSVRLLRSFSRAERRRVRFAVSLDMVGVGTTLHVRGIEASPNRSAARALRRARALGIRATYLQDSGQSDHAEMSRSGLPAAWLQWRWDNCWHEPCDVIQRLRPRKLWRAGRVTLAAARAALR
jgi:Peptidase family M28